VATVAILGAGGVGGLLAAVLQRAGTPVTVVAREPTADALQQTGLTVRSPRFGEFTAHPAVVTQLRAPANLLVVATKATGLPAALDRIQTTPDVVLPLLNGVEHLADLRARFAGAPVVAAAIRVDADRPEPGVIVHSGPDVRVDVAGDAQELGALLQDAGIEVRTGGSEADVMWSKLARLCPLALTTSASLRPIGFVREDPRWRSALENAVAETVTVAIAEGATPSWPDPLAELDAAPAGLGSSMQRDLLAGREPELDAIAGAVMRAGMRHGLRCPTVQWLAERVALRAAVPRERP
jgi:2-dehydropantoate 2-reductase